MADRTPGAYPDQAECAVMPAPAVKHPLFARFWTFLSRNEPAEIKRHRDELLAGLSGRVIELGAGGGANFGHYPRTVESVLAVEPEPYLREKARAAAAKADVPIDVVDGEAGALPAADGRSTPPSPASCCARYPTSPLRWRNSGACSARVAELRFYEHVLSHRRGVAASQRAVDATFWPHAFGGCHTARDTPGAIEAAGFTIEEQRRMWVNPVQIAVPAATHAIGRARRD